MSNYSEKEAWFQKNSQEEFYNFKSVSAAEFYRDLFPEGTFENRVGHKDNYEKTNKGNGFIVYTEDEKKHTRMVFDDLAELFELQKNSCAFMSPISYFGRHRTAKNARFIYALTFDLDEVGEKQIDLLFGFWIFQKRIPRPTYVVNSGGGVHLYYFFKEPIPMIPKNQKALKILKYELTSKIWNEDTSGLEDVQYQGLNQGFRLVGSKTKHGETVTCWKTGGRITVQELADYIPKANAKDVGILYRMWHSTMSLEEAKKKYPEWYEQRIVMGRKKSSWTNKRALYDWWLKQAPLARYHHRYWYIFALTVYGAKCGIPLEEVEIDALNLVEDFNRINPDEPFTEDDVYAALKAYDEEHKSFTRDEISKVTAIIIEPNKRNGRPQELHLEMARSNQALLDKYNGTNWRDGNGRPSKEKVVFDYLCKNPNATKAEVIRATGLSKKTVYKYYDELKDKAENIYANNNHINSSTREFG